MAEGSIKRMAEIVGACVTIMRPNGLPSVDFQDERSLFLEGEVAITGIGEASGPNRATLAAEAAIEDLLRSLGK